VHIRCGWPEPLLNSWRYTRHWTHEMPLTYCAATGTVSFVPASMTASPSQKRPRAHDGTSVRGRQTPLAGMARESGQSGAAKQARRHRRQQQVQQDQRSGFLSRASVGVESAARYRKAVEDFRSWATEQRLRFDSIMDLDITLEKYFEFLYFDGCEPHEGRQTMYGEAYVRKISIRAGDVLPSAKQALRGWLKRAPERSKDPMPWLAVFPLVEELLNLGSTAALEAAALLPMHFDAYLRPTEGLELSVSDVILPQRWAGARFNKVSLLVRPQGDEEDPRPAKNGEFDGTVVLAETAERAGVKCIAKQLVDRARRNKQTLLFPALTLPLYEKLIATAAVAAGLGALRLTPHTARHGGASEDAFSGQCKLPELQRRWRWRSPRSVQRYEKHGTLLRQLAAFPADARTRSKRLQRRGFEKLLAAIVSAR